MKLFLVATDGIDLGDPTNLPQLGTDDPVLQGAQCGRVIRLTVGLPGIGFGVYAIQEDLTQTGRDGPHLWFKPGRHLAPGALEPFIDQVSREIDVRAVIEYDRHL